MNLVEKVRAYLLTRRHNYIHTFNTPTGEAVLRDLSKFCRAHETTFHENDRATALLEGRREVWLRIAHHLNLSEEELWDKYRQKDLTNE